MKNKFLRLIALISLVAIVATLLVACGNTSASSGSGTYGSVVWSYSSDTKTLTVSGAGDIPSALPNDNEAPEDAPKNVAWAAARSSAVRVVVSSGITSVGDYAFHGMSALEEVSLPEGLTSIGKCAFAFCSKLDELTIPSTVATVGESAFEGCVALESIKLPAAATSVGDRAFAFCRSLKVVLIAGVPTQIGHWTFKDCAALTSLAIAVDESETPAVVAEYSPTAFEGAGTSTPVPYKNQVIVTVYYKDLAGGEDPRAPLTEYKSFGDAYSYLAPSIDGYTVEGESQKQGTIEGNDLTLIFNYSKSAEIVPPAETEPAAPVEEEEKNPVVTIVTISIFVLVIGGIIIGAVLLIRSDKKAKKNGTTVRKNNDGDGKNGKAKKK